jgi:hypothetical protein
MCAPVRRSKETLPDLASAERQIKSGKLLSAEELACLLDRSRSLKIPRLILDRVSQLLRQPSKRGPKPVSKAGLAWTLDRAIDLYDRRLRQIRRELAANRAKARASRTVRPRA